MNSKQESETIFLHNHGHPGKNTRFILEILPSLPLGEVDLVFLMIGTNDTLNSNTLIGIEEYENNMAKIITTIQENNFILVSNLITF